MIPRSWRVLHPRFLPPRPEAPLEKVVERKAFMDQTCPVAWFIFKIKPVYDPYNAEAYMVWHQIWDVVRWEQGINGAYGMWN